MDAAGGWTLRLPASRMKGGRPHAVLLPRAAIELLEPIRGGQGLIFSATGGKTSFAGWKRAAACVARVAALEESRVVHDIRRGAATGMGDAGIREAVIARILAHSLKAFLGITRTYERSERSEEVRAALELWSNVLGGVVGPQPGIAPANS